jgi:transcriptional regulator with XRE-family HTH domain
VEVPIMLRPKSTPVELAEVAPRLAAARRARGLSQAELAQRCRLKRQQITYFETGARTPSLGQLLHIARALDLPLQRFLSGSDRPGGGPREIAIELRRLGLIDLWVEGPLVPGAFRRPEEVVALAVAGKEPEARIVEAIPALLAWNRWNGSLLRAFARETGRATLYRLAWLADVALALDRLGGFPGGCPGKEDLAAFVKRLKRPPSARWDDLGRPAETPPTSPLWKRWRISYAADLATFRQRAEGLVSLAKAEGRASPVQEG